MDEFAFGSSTENSFYGPTRNPWATDYVPGGSSGGSAAAIAAQLALGAFGSDTGGSIRQPAAFCGVVGLKPTYGRVSRYGLIAFASSLDQIGPFTRTVADNAALLQVIAGFDSRDSTSVDTPVPDFTAALSVKDLKGKKLGIPKEYFGEGTDPEVRQALEAGIEQLKALGAQVQEVSLPNTEYAVPTYYVLAPAEASSNLARFDGVRYAFRAPSTSLRMSGNSGEDSNLLSMYMQTREEGFGPEAKRRVVLGTYVLSSGYYDAYYGQALKVRTLIKQDFDQVFEQVDCLVTPTSPTPAFKIGEKLDDPLTMYLSDILTISVNLAGVPALSVPCGFTKSGLPIGMQLITKPFDEATLFEVGHAYQGGTDFHLKEPEIE